MKNVLIYFGNYCSEDSRGGTEVATYRIAKALKDSGLVNVFHAFHNGEEKTENSIYSSTVRLSKNPAKLVESLSEFIDKEKIDHIIVMGRFFKFDKIKKAAEKSSRTPRLYFMQHFAPGSERKKTTYKSSWHLLRLNPKRTRYYFRALFYPLLKLPRTLRWGKVYRNVYEGSDKVILLSDGYKKDYSKVAALRDDSKFVAIPNIFENEVIENEVPKEKRVLILSRMDEIQKRISVALDIWERIENDPDLSEWHLDIVGDGNNMDIVRRLVKKKGFSNVKIHGWKDRTPFLERSSILMMTSEYEGLPLSLLEAQAHGVVPIAFDSFASLRDVITEYENGVIVDRYGDIEDYTKKLSELMYDEAYRNELSRNARKGNSRFTSKKVAEEWLKILT